MPAFPATVEQIFLGTLLLRPAGAPRIQQLVRAEDFTDDWHRAVYSAWRDRPDGDLETIGRELHQRLGASRVDPARLHGLVASPPPVPDLAGYAAMIVTSSLRRQVARAAVLVHACGSVHSPSSGEVHQVAQRVREVIDGLHRRSEQLERPDSGKDGPTPGPSTSAGDARGPSGTSTREVLHQCLSADRVLSRGPTAVDAEAAQHNEIRFVASLFCRTSRILPWADRIRPGWLTAREWAPVLAALQDRAELGESLDVVSVCWQVQRASLAEGPGPGLGVVQRAVEDYGWQDPDFLGRQVAHQLLRRAAVNAAESIRTAAANPGLRLPDLFHTVEVMLQAIEWAAEPLTDQPLPAVDPSQHPDRALHLDSSPEPLPQVPGAASSAIGW